MQSVLNSSIERSSSPGSALLQVPHRTDKSLKCKYSSETGGLGRHGIRDYSLRFPACQTSTSISISMNSTALTARGARDIRGPGAQSFFRRQSASIVAWSSSWCKTNRGMEIFHAAMG